MYKFCKKKICKKLWHSWMHPIWICSQTGQNAWKWPNHLKNGPKDPNMTQNNQKYWKKLPKTSENLPLLQFVPNFRTNQVISQCCTQICQVSRDKNGILSQKSSNTGKSQYYGITQCYDEDSTPLAGQETLFSFEKIHLQRPSSSCRKNYWKNNASTKGLRRMKDAL